ncbi:hypothetical protein [Candidatus Enterovibrio escicola]|uniref:hypothetical protein n=1 Tax=Candidatus Enterovibrio escicola TaxID=1927127 RepID=UPI001237C2CE|nr:hypothetical protein [Candidatus Enterovibrio escacola]
MANDFYRTHTEVVEENVMLVELPLVGGNILELNWKESSYEGLLSCGENKCELLYGGKSFHLECGADSFKRKITTGKVITEGGLDISSAIKYVDGKPVIDKNLITDLLSVDFAGEVSWIESVTSLKDWNNPVVPYHFNSSCENEDWGDLVDIQYHPNEGAFNLVFTQNQYEANKRYMATPAVFMEFVTLRFGQGTANGSDSLIYTFPLNRFLWVRSKVIKLLLEYTESYHLCCGWEAAHYCPHHTPPEERI